VLPMHLIAQNSKYFAKKRSKYCLPESNEKQVQVK